jgi:hypothetical protein
MATDFRSGKDFPRRGRDKIGNFNWLPRVFDKARAARDQTIHDYIYPCPIDRGVLERWGLTPAEFDQAIQTIDTDEDILAWVKARVSEERLETANTWVLVDKAASLDKQDAEEGFVVS